MLSFNEYCNEDVKEDTKASFLKASKDMLNLITKLADIADKATEEKILDGHPWFADLINLQISLQHDIKKLEEQ
jgi:hypothetical protein